MALVCLDEVAERFRRRGASLFPYQVEAARRVVEDMGGSGILADEVGLGKTVEAGLVILELARRERVRDVLVLVPASLTYQWRRELAEKFGLAARARLEAGGLVVASLDTAKRGAAAEACLGRAWDLLLVDEAHRLKNPRTQVHRFTAALRRRHTVLISATPLQNDLTELHALVSLVRPELFGGFEEFQRRFLLDRRTPRDPAALRALLERVMVRHRRGDFLPAFPRRHVRMVPVDPTPEERELYEAVTEAVRAEYWRRVVDGGSVLPLIALQREACSSPAALRATLERMGDGDWRRRHGHLWTLAAAARNPAKALALTQLVRRIEGKVLVYTEFRATQEDIVARLRADGVPVAAFHGGLTAAAKDEALHAFAQRARVLVSTECGGEGLNLQFCRHLVNYDLPWNPMRVEQRIGRVHRLGQAEDVWVYNLYVRDTIEEALLDLLHEKIDLFRQVVGELDVILRQLERKRSFERTILHIALSARDRRELEARFAQLGEQMVEAGRRAGAGVPEPAGLGGGRS
ncbi:MAG: DEAD/DEAH box helicase [Firmicutes bacterium]|nr:DEAD/DEAH box helicase [Bacillota bacterium]